MTISPTPVPPTTVVDSIRQATENYHNDPGYPALRNILISAEFRQHSQDARTATVIAANFAFTYGPVQRQKARAGTLDPRLEKMLLTRAQDAQSAFRTLTVPALQYLDGQLSRKPAGACMNRHAAPLSQYLPSTSNYASMIEDISLMGVPSDAIGCGADQMAAVGYNFLRVPGMNGTVESLAPCTQAIGRELDNFVGILQQHGVPVIEGAGNAGPVVGSVAVTVIFIGIFAGVAAAAVFA